MATEKQFFDKNQVGTGLNWSITNGSIAPNGVIVLSKDGHASVKLAINSFACSTIRQDVEFSTLNTYNAYNGQCFSNVSVKLTGNDGENRADYSILLNQLNYVDGVYKCVNYVDLPTTTISEIELSFTNKGDNDLTIVANGLYFSRDIEYYQLVEVFKSDVIYGDVVQATANFSEAMFTQFLQTNVFSMDAIKSFGGGVVNYLKAEDWTLGFYTAQLSSTETEQFKVIVKTGNKNEEISFWYAIIGDHPDAYKYITTIDPRSKWKDITDENREKFKFRVWKKDSEQKKLSIEFAEVSDGKGGKTMSPVFILGAGVTDDPKSMKGKMLIYKDVTGAYVKYVTSTGKEHGFVADETGAYFIGVLMRLERFERYRNGAIAKFQGDPTGYQLRFSEDEVKKELNGIWINNKDFVASPYIDKDLPSEN